MSGQAQVLSQWAIGTCRHSSATTASKVGIGKEATDVALQDIRVIIGEIASISGYFAHLGMFAALAESIPKSSARLGIVCWHSVVSAMLCPATSQLSTDESILDSSSP
jgi:hypothetical protein